MNYFVQIAIGKKLMDRTYDEVEPKPNPDIVKAAREAYERGDYLTTEEFLEEIRARKHGTTKQ